MVMNSFLDRNLYMNCLIRIFIIVHWLPVFLWASSIILQGEVKDSRTNHPLQDVNIEILQTGLGTSTTDQGYFEIKNIPYGNHVVKVTCVGYKKTEKWIEVNEKSKTIVWNIFLEPVAIEGESIIVTGRAAPRRAVQRQSPVAFTKLNRLDISNNYTTGNVAQLIQNVPGVWTSTAGLGEAKIYMRGFSSQGIRILINDIPINNTEDHTVIWSNWAGLSHMSHSIEVQRGPGFSMLSPNAFGGSVNISTIGIEPYRKTTFRVSGGIYNRMGIASGPNAGKIADRTDMSAFRDVGIVGNYTYSARFNSGPLFDNQLNTCLFLERKAGDSYLIGTDYDGYNIGIEAEGTVENHDIYTIFFVSTQSHGQAFALQDIDLLKTLGREYNRKNHDWQENFYTKPFWSVNHSWRLSQNKKLTTNVFLTMGRGGDQSCVNDAFDVQTGLIDFQPSTKAKDAYAFGRHAQYLYANYGLITTDFIPISLSGGPYFVYKDIPFESDYNGENFFIDQHMHSYQRINRRDHWQSGINSILNQKLSHHLLIHYGLEARYWRGHRESEVGLLKVSNFSSPRHKNSPTGKDIFLSNVQSLYDYDTRVINLSAFSRLIWKPIERLNLQAGLPVYYTYAEVIENPIRFMDFGSLNFFDVAKRTTADMKAYGAKFGITNDYLRQYHYCAPWMGGNYNINSNINIFSRIALSQKEPVILDWYDYHNGPLLQKDKYPEQEKAVSLEAEKIYGAELGVGYLLQHFSLNTNYYYSIYDDKIERVIDINGRQTTLNAGKAIMQGLEFSAKWHNRTWDFSTTATFSRNRWQKMNVSTIFDAPASDVEEKVVPFSPEHLLSAVAGYHFNIGDNHRFHIQLRLNYWDEYYGTYTNTYFQNTEQVIDGSHYTIRTEKQAKLPYFLDLSARMRYMVRTKALEIEFRVDANNMLNRSDNFMEARYSIDYTRNDFYEGRYKWYVLQAPLFNLFFTMEINVRE
ncbi:MAG: TonB-dependent receptor plug domain-containing protein [Caldithrix sp.]|nr:TonB-dependent receptor plug domain-containing protein [Caldithrix sp.]